MAMKKISLTTSKPALASLALSLVLATAANAADKPKTDTTSAQQQNEQQSSAVTTSDRTEAQPAAKADEPKPAAETATAATEPQTQPATQDRASSSAVAQDQPDAQAAPAGQPAAASPASSNSGLAGAVQVADDDVKERSERTLAGRKVVGSDGKDLGEVKDFFVDRGSGDVVFALVSSGGIAGIGDKLHLVPFKALRSNAEENEFAVSMDKAGWEKMAAIDEEQFKSGRLTVSDGERRQIAQNFGGKDASGEATYTASNSAHLIRASDLRGKDVRAGGEDAGSIETLVIDESAGTAVALLDPKKDFVDTTDKFLVPLNRLSFGTNKDEPATTVLARTDFQNQQSGFAIDSAAASAPVATTSTPAAPDVRMRKLDKAANTEATTSTEPGKAETSTAVAANVKEASPKSASSAERETAEEIASSRSAGADRTKANDQQGRSIQQETNSTANIAANTPTTEPQLTPTGKTSADQTPTGDAALIGAAQAIRAALDENAELASADITVKPEDGRLMLRGKVKSEALKKSAIQAAEDAAKGKSVDASELTIEK